MFVWDDLICGGCLFEAHSYLPSNIISLKTFASDFLIIGELKNRTENVKVAVIILVYLHCCYYVRPEVISNMFYLMAVDLGMWYRPCPTC